jgi:hypothetical protein
MKQNDPRPGADLDDWEIDNACAGYVQNAARVRFLRGLGLMVRQKPNGRPLVNRAHYDTVMGGRRAATEDQIEAEDGIRWRVPL